MVRLRKSTETNRSKLEVEIIRLEDQLEIVNARVRILEGLLQTKRAQLLALDIAKGSPLGARNLKNDQFHAAWWAIRRSLAAAENKGGLLQAELFSAVCSELPRLKDVTFRSYLLRLKKQQLLIKRGAYWFLVSTSVVPTQMPKRG